MIIEENDFRLISLKDSCGIFDLELLKTVNKGKDTERQEFKNVAYGISFDRAMQYVIHDRLEKRNPEVINTKTYLKEYRDLVKDIKQLCGN